MNDEMSLPCGCKSSLIIRDDSISTSMKLDVLQKEHAIDVILYVGSRPGVTKTALINDCESFDSPRRRSRFNRIIELCNAGVIENRGFSEDSPGGLYLSDLGVSLYDHLDAMMSL